MRKAGQVLLLLLLAGCSAAIGAETGGGKLAYPRLGPPWPERRQPSWINRGLVFVGSWEPLPWVYRKNWQNFGSARSGSTAEAIYREERSEATVLGLKSLGVNMVLTAFHKGFGIASEKATMEEARQFARLLHKHGLKMGVYVSALLLYEDLYREFPEAKDWHRVQIDGTPDVYDLDGYRFRAFLNHPGYVNYMKRVCQLAVEAGADLIHFDVISQPALNFHPLCESMFRDWLKKEYPARESWFFRTGLQNWDYVRVPHYPQPASYETFEEPMMQEYLRFVAQLVGQYAAEMSTFIRSLNPECAVEFNPAGIAPLNMVLARSIHHPAILPWLDAFWSEDLKRPSYASDGRLVSGIRSFKVGQQYNCQTFTYGGSQVPLADRRFEIDPDPRLSLAQSMAFNRQCLGCIGWPLIYKEFPALGRRYIQFFWKHFELFAKADTAAEVAVLRGFASMAYNNRTTHQQTMLAEQALIQGQVVWDMIDDHNLADLSKYRVVVLANQESLSDDQVEQLRKYVRKGGGLLATGETSRLDPWRRDRGGLGLADVLGVSSSGTTPQRRAFGAGRAAYLPALRARPRMTLPENARELVDCIGWAAGGRLKLEVQAPASVAVESYRRPAEKREIVHLLNFAGPAHAAEKVQVNWRAGGNAAPKFTFYSPDESEPRELAPSATPEGVQVKLPKFAVYSILVIQR